MRPITADDLQEFWDTGADYLAADTSADDEGFLLHLDTGAFGDRDRPPAAYDHAETDQGRTVLILCERAALTDGEWLPDLLNADGEPQMSVFAGAAEIITDDGLIPAACSRAAVTARQWAEAAEAAEFAAMVRARTVADVVDLAGGSQAEAGRLLGLDPSRVQRLTKKARRA